MSEQQTEEMIGSGVLEVTDKGYGFLRQIKNNFRPMPGDTFVVLGAVLVGRGQLSFWPAYLATTAGSLSGFMLLFYTGQKWGRTLITHRLSRWFNEVHINRVDIWFARYGIGLIAINRFLAGFRAVVSLAAGIARMDAKRVFVLALISCLLWNFLLMSLGIWVGENWSAILQHYQRWISLAVLAVIVIVAVKYYRKKRKGI